MHGTMSLKKSDVVIIRNWRTRNDRNGKNYTLSIFTICNFMTIHYGDNIEQNEMSGQEASVRW